MLDGGRLMFCQAKTTTADTSYAVGYDYQVKIHRSTTILYAALEGAFISLMSSQAAEVHLKRPEVKLDY